MSADAYLGGMIVKPERVYFIRAPAPHSERFGFTHLMSADAYLGGMIVKPERVYFIRAPAPHSER
ncbi:hypothetical protein GJ26_18965, partial [Vibrio cholerae]